MYEGIGQLEVPKNRSKGSCSAYIAVVIDSEQRIPGFNSCSNRKKKAVTGIPVNELPEGLEY